MTTFDTPAEALIRDERRARTGDLSRLDREAADNLARDLEGVIEGEVRFEDGDRALYANDASNYRQLPIGVVIPRTVADVVATVAECRRHGAPIVSRGGATSIGGQSVNVAVIIDFSKYVNRIVELSPERRFARVEPGVVLDALRDAAEVHHLTFGPDPATHDRCTLGGMIGNNSCGTHSLMAGKTSDNIEELEILTYDGLRLTVGETSDHDLASIIAAGGRRGQIYAAMRALRDRYADRIRRGFPDLPRRVSGYPLRELLPENGFHVARALVGTESTCVTVLEAKVRLVPSPRSRLLAVIVFPDIATAGDHTPRVLEAGPIGLEAIDGKFVDGMRKKQLLPGDVALLPPGGRAFMLAEFGGDSEAEARSKVEGLKLRMAGSGFEIKVMDADAARRIWRVRESGLGATAHVPGERENHEGWEDSSVPVDRLGDYLRDFRKKLDEFGYHGALYGHFGQGCVHTRIDFDLTTREGVAKFRRFVTEMAHVVVGHGGSLSGEHGDGQARGELLPIMYGGELVRAFGEFKRIWDPDGRMNPGKVVDPYPLDSNLRLGPGYRPPVLETHFQWPADDGSFAKASRRCVGVGECRREGGGTMCPSYMVTREEKHSTRGRARLLFEMMQGDAVRGGFHDEYVKESLDLCLACKGCKGDCPVKVDLASYKAEFLSHYYEGRLRPRTAYTMGWIFRWARLAEWAPNLANFFTHAPGLGRLAKLLAGVAPQREVPRFAAETFKQWLRRTSGSRAPGRGGPRVILWPDTFNDHFRPRIARAAFELMEALGFEVVVPDRHLCCGRPLYDFGMLDLAKRKLREILSALAPEIEAGTPVIGLEPSCVAVFRDELPNLFPRDEAARRLCDQTALLGEFLARQDHLPLPRLPAERKALVHSHCHQSAIGGTEEERRVLGAMGLDVEVLDSGCCGMAGAFGFEEDHYDISIACGERVLLPAVRSAPRGALVIADGFSCREQIEQAADARPLHLAEVMQMARGDRAPALRGGLRPAEWALAAGALIAGIAMAWSLLGRRRRRKGAARAR